MPLFRKKPVVVQAWLWNGEQELARELYNLGLPIDTAYTSLRGELPIKTLEGVMLAQQGDWIIQGVQGEFYPCKPDIFDATYEEA